MSDVLSSQQFGGVQPELPLGNNLPAEPQHLGYTGSGKPIYSDSARPKAPSNLSTDQRSFIKAEALAVMRRPSSSTGKGYGWHS